MRKKVGKRAIERQLAPKLRFLGYLLLVFSVGCFIYDFFPHSKIAKNSIEYELADELEEHDLRIQLADEISSIPPLKRELILLGVGSFFVIGLACVFFSRRVRQG